jgi:hypothetical protein
MAAGIDCYAPGVSALVQTGHRHHHKHHHSHRARDENDDTEKEPDLPTCDGSNGPKGVNCLARVTKMCPGNQAPTLKDGEVANCIIWPTCAENPGMAAGIDCY